MSFWCYKLKQLVKHEFINEYIINNTPGEIHVLMACFNNIYYEQIENIFPYQGNKISS